MGRLSGGFSDFVFCVLPSPGDWRKFDPDYDPDELFKAIVEEGRQGREFKRKFWGLGENEAMYPVK